MSELAFSFGRIAAEYDDVRPEYAPEALDRAAEVLGLSADSRVVDLAAGSGKLTRALASRFAEVVAVEPNDEMRGVLAGRSAGIRVLAGTAERMPLPDASADAVFVGDAFHWFDGDAAVAEHPRATAPGRDTGAVRRDLHQLGPRSRARRDGGSPRRLRRRTLHAAH